MTANSDGGASTAAPLRIPLHSRTGEILAYALVSPEDEALGAYRWHRNAHGYAVRLVTVDEMTPKGKKRQRAIFLHREILGLKFGDRRQADHISRDRLDCRRENLRIVTQAQSMQNRNGWGKSQHRGVSPAGNGRFQAYTYVSLGGRQRKISLGLYDDEDQAGAIAAEFRKMVMPFATD